MPFGIIFPFHRYGQSTQVLMVSGLGNSTRLYYCGWSCRALFKLTWHLVWTAYTLPGPVGRGLSLLGLHRWNILWLYRCCQKSRIYLLVCLHVVMGAWGYPWLLLQGLQRAWSAPLGPTVATAQLAHAQASSPASSVSYLRRRSTERVEGGVRLNSWLVELSDLGIEIKS